MPELDFEGRRIPATAGQTVAAALIAHGVRVFGRSAKYHRPRGVRCANGTCSCCAMRVDGLPGVRTCVTPVRDGMRVEREHAWPSARVDLLRAAELAGPALNAGAYYRWFRRSPRLWGLAERLLAAGAGQGELPAAESAARFAGARCETRRDVDVLVAGGGVAGLSAGLAAARAGARTVVVERHHSLGGGFAADTASYPEAAALLGLSPLPASGCDLAGELRGRAAAEPELEVVAGAEVVGWYEEGVVALVRGIDLVLCAPRAVVLATGGHELVPPFVNGDLPGVMTGGAVQRLLVVHGVRPWRVATVLANDARGYALAAQLAAAGVAVACVADQRPAGRVPDAERRVAADLGIRTVAGVRGVSAHGLNAVRAVTLQVQPEGSASRRSLRSACDLICVCLGARPADELAWQAVSAGRYALSSAGPPDFRSAAAPGQPAEEVAAPGGVELFVAGGAAGAWSAAAAIAGGSAAGRAAARDALLEGPVPRDC